MVIKAVMAVIVLLVVYEIIGTAFTSVIKGAQNVCKNILYGYLIYFTAFEVVYLLILSINNNLKLLTIVWLVVLTAGIAVSVMLARSALVRSISRIGYELAGVWKAVLVAGVATLALIILYVCGVTYMADESYAYGVIADAADTGKMFIRNIYTGAELEKLAMPYALSGYYMHSAMLCSILKITPMIMQHNVMGTICILISVIIVYLMGRQIFGDSYRYTCGLIVFYELINVYLLLYSRKPYFLLTGAYDELTQTAYVLIPALLLGYIMLIKGVKELSAWSTIMLCSTASCGVSSSSVLVVPLAILCGMITVAVCRKNYRAMARGGICMIPSIIYIVVYCICK